MFISVFVFAAHILSKTRIDIHSRMASLDEEITALKAETEGYKLRLNDATSAENIRMWAGLIKSCNDRLTIQEKRKDTQSDIGGAGVSAGRYLRKYLS